MYLYLIYNIIIICVITSILLCTNGAGYEYDSPPRIFNRIAYPSLGKGVFFFIRDYVFFYFSIFGTIEVMTMFAILFKDRKKVRLFR